MASAGVFVGVGLGVCALYESNSTTSALADWVKLAESVNGSCGLRAKQASPCAGRIASLGIAQTATPSKRNCSVFTIVTGILRLRGVLPAGNVKVNSHA